MPTREYAEKKAAAQAAASTAFMCVCGQCSGPAVVRLLILIPIGNAPATSPPIEGMD